MRLTIDHQVGLSFNLDLGSVIGILVKLVATKKVGEPLAVDDALDDSFAATFLLTGAQDFIVTGIQIITGGGSQVMVAVVVVGGFSALTKINGVHALQKEEKKKRKKNQGIAGFLGKNDSQPG